jgi:multisubunit Na+/H+ antiporter MnhB subunit
LIQALVILISIGFLIDGFRRTKQSLKEGESIASRFILLILVAYGVSFAVFLCYYLNNGTNNMSPIG